VEMDKVPNTVSNDAVSDLTRSTTSAWIDDNPVGRCTSAHHMTSDSGPVNVRCDGQAGHAGRHQATVNGALIYWRDDPTERAAEGEQPTEGADPQGDGS
jgi:hypothetical protein